MAADIESIYLTVGELVNQARVRQRLTQEELGRRLAPPMTRASIANIESGKQRVQVHTLVQLASVLDTPISSLLGVPSMEEAHHQAIHADREIVGELTEKLGGKLAPEQFMDLLQKLSS